MDQIDRKILDILQRDGRITMKALSGEISMSVPAASERVRRLEEQGIILGYHAEVDLQALGCQVEAIVLATVRDGQEMTLREFVQKCPAIVEAWDLAGRVGLMLKVRCINMAAFQDVVRDLQTMSATESYMFLNCCKQQMLSVEALPEEFQS